MTTGTDKSSDDSPSGKNQENKYEVKFVLKKFLEAVGLIGAPTGIIAFFCQIMDVSARTTGAISLAVVCLVSLCLYRHFINARIPSVVVASLLIALSAIFFLNYDNILLKNTGLIKYYKRSSEFQSDLLEEMKSSKSEVWFFGTNFYKLPYAFHC